MTFALSTFYNCTQIAGPGQLAVLVQFDGAVVVIDYDRDEGPFVGNKSSLGSHFGNTGAIPAIFPGTGFQGQFTAVQIYTECAGGTIKKRLTVAQNLAFGTNGLYPRRHGEIAGPVVGPSRIPVVPRVVYAVLVFTQDDIVEAELVFIRAVGFGHQYGFWTFGLLGLTAKERKNHCQ